MKLTLTAFFFLASIMMNAMASDEITPGLPGSYTRAITGMYSETVSLNADGSYLFTFQFDVGSREERGTWKVRDMVVVLSPKQSAGPNKGSPKQFRVLGVDGDLALSAIETATEAEPEESDLRLFRPTKKGAD